MAVMTFHCTRAGSRTELRRFDRLADSVDYWPTVSKRMRINREGSLSFPT